MRGDEVRALGHLGGQVVGEVAGWAEELHRAVAARTFRSLGVLGLPIRQVHDVVSGGSYAAVRAVAQSAGDVAGALLAGVVGGETLSASPAGGQAVAALDALLGDRLDQDRSPPRFPAPTTSDC